MIVLVEYSFGRGPLIADSAQAYLAAHTQYVRCPDDRYTVLVTDEILEQQGSESSDLVRLYGVCGKFIRWQGVT